MVCPSERPPEFFWVGGILVRLGGSTGIPTTVFFGGNLEKYAQMPPSGSQRPLVFSLLLSLSLSPRFTLPKSPFPEAGKPNCQKGRRRTLQSKKVCESDDTQPLSSGTDWDFWHCFGKGREGERKVEVFEGVGRRKKVSPSFPETERKHKSV